MTVHRSLALGAALAAAMLFGAAAGVAAQTRPLFEWQGRVDREARLVIRGRSLQVRDANALDLRRSRPSVREGLPREDGFVTIRTLAGRGSVQVIQQPSRRNGYTATVLISDSRSGAGEYRIEALWRPARAAAVVPPNRGRGQAGPDSRPRNGGNNDRPNNGRSSDGRPGDGRFDGARSNGHGSLHWSGAVDDQVEIRIQGRQARYFNVKGNGTREVHEALSGALPARNAILRVTRHKGRGSVLVVQQPSSRNGYTAVIRIRDPGAGMAFYDFDVSW